MIRIIRKPTDTAGDDSTSMVVSALQKRGVAFEFLDLQSLDGLNTGIAGDLIWVCGIRQDPALFEILNILAIDNLVVNSPDAIATCASKARTTARLIRDGVPTPATVFTADREVAREFIALHGKVVYKPLYGFDGNGIFPLSSAGKLGDPPYYLQEFVENDRDFRVFVIDGEAVGAIERRSDSFAHNIHQGGTGRPAEITPAMAEISHNAALAIGIDYCGVDLLVSGDGYTVLEVNGTPNWHCMGVPIPELLAEYLVRRERDLQ
jgi:tetrahydromethanopterin:alpha-L-glutamate ligase